MSWRSGKLTAITAFEANPGKNATGEKDLANVQSYQLVICDDRRHVGEPGHGDELVSNGSFSSDAESINDFGATAPGPD